MSDSVVSAISPLLEILVFFAKLGPKNNRVYRKKKGLGVKVDLKKKNIEGISEYNLANLRPAVKIARATQDIIKSIKTTWTIHFWFMYSHVVHICYA